MGTFRQSSAPHTAQCKFQTIFVLNLLINSTIKEVVVRSSVPGLKRGAPYCFPLRPSHPSIPANAASCACAVWCRMTEKYTACVRVKSPSHALGASQSAHTMPLLDSLFVLLSSSRALRGSSSPPSVPPLHPPHLFGLRPMSRSSHYRSWKACFAACASQKALAKHTALPIHKSPQGGQECCRASTLTSSLDIHVSLPFSFCTSSPLSRPSTEASKQAT